MFTQMKKRKYRQKRRAEQVEDTRQQIVEAAMLLHEKLGPAQTPITAIAEQAGVQRLTVYRHFPDEESLIQACSSHWLALHPPPQDSWSAEKEPLERCRKALKAFYDYYRETERMWQVCYRDMDRVEPVRKIMDGFETELDGLRDNLLADLKPRAGKKVRVSAILRHALRLGTWQSLRDEKLDNQEMADAFADWLSAA